MKKVLKVLGWGWRIVVVVIAAGVGYLQLAFPSVGPVPDIKVEVTPEPLTSGRYQANHVNVCIDCHSMRNWTYFSAPPTAGTEGKGESLR